MKRRPLLVTVDVECDKGPDWRTASPLRFDGVHVGIGERLHPVAMQLGLRPTYLLSPEVLCDPDSVSLLRSLEHCELGSHLHGEYVAPDLASLQFDGARTDDMQSEYDSATERDKLATLTELFRQQVGCQPRSFRAGRFGIGRHSGAHLLELGYRCDSSVTPLVQWTSQHGHKHPDFRTSPFSCWFVDEGGDLCRQGASSLYEIPVTIRGTKDAPRWLRPWYSTREELFALIDEVAAEDDTPLCMMFHNVELIAKGSPYPQCDAEVQRYLDDFVAAIAHAKSRGFVPMTMHEAQQQAWAERGADAGHPVTERDASTRDRTVVWSNEAVQSATTQHGTQGWHAYSHECRAERWDLTEPYSFLADHLDRSDAVLDLGCGIASNLCYLAGQGFDNLLGFDADATAIAAGDSLRTQHGQPIRLWVDDGLQPEAIPDETFGAITAVNWTYLLDGFSLSGFFSTYAPRLQPGGYLVLDAIDPAFDRHPKNQWLSGDWNKPEHERRPSEYRHRHSRADMRQAAHEHGLEIVREYRRDAEIPRAVYVLQRPQRRSVLFVVDAKGWAHDHKAHNLARYLPQRFDSRIVYQDDLTERDLDESDLIVVFYWRQLESLAGLGEALARNRDRLLMGVCSHNELEGELRERGLSLLRQLPARVFTHSEILEAEVRPLLPGTAAHCLPNGVDTSFYQPGPRRAEPGPRTKPLRIGWAGSLDNFGADMRGVSTILQPAIERLQASHPGRFELVLAAREDRLRTPEEMRAFYQGLDVYVCASRVEGTPNPCLEAAACGVPIVSTRVGNMPELVAHGTNGLLVDRSVKALAAALLLLEQNEPAREQMADNVRTTTERSWDWRTRARGFADMFDEVLAAAPSRTTQEVLS